MLISQSSTVRFYISYKMLRIYSFLIHLTSNFPKLTTVKPLIRRHNVGAPAGSAQLANVAIQWYVRHIGANFMTRLRNLINRAEALKRYYYECLSGPVYGG